MTAVVHAVRIGHADHTPHPERHHAACHCRTCDWSTHLDDADRPRASGVGHAAETGHLVLFEDATSTVAIEALCDWCHRRPGTVLVVRGEQAWLASVECAGAGEEVP